MDPGLRVSAIFPDGKIGIAMFGTRNMEVGDEEGTRKLGRLAIPRRIYTPSHVH